MKWLVTATLMVTCLGVYAQKKDWKKDKAMVLLEAMSKEFDLDDEQKTAVFEAQLESTNATREINAEAKAEKITKDEKKAI